MNQNWHDTVRDLLKRSRRSERDLATATKVPQASVNRYLSGKSPSLKKLQCLNKGMAELIGIPSVENYLNWFWVFEYTADVKKSKAASNSYGLADMVELISAWLGEFAERLRPDYRATISNDISTLPPKVAMDFVRELFEANFERIVRVIDMRVPARPYFDELMQICSKYLSIGDIKKTADFIWIHESADQVLLAIMDAISITANIALSKKERDPLLVSVQLEQEARTRRVVFGLLSRIGSEHFRKELVLTRLVIGLSKKQEDTEPFLRRLAELEASDLREFGQATDLK